ncbi:hypothetical protein ACH4D4_09585 [Streptomyces pristinaespiralis]|jgi:hypothetical protein|uniref:hypothetical protein n=1 Tax=Streptomyces pristinaespiralis TaxID=38300 RepID=UPI0037924019
MSNPQQTPRTPAIRLIFEYEGDSVRLVFQQPVDTVISGFDTVAGTGSGNYVVETRDDRGQRLDRVPARGAFLESAEVFPENHTQPIIRVDVEARGAFTVIVPASAEATQVAVVRVAPPGGEALQDVDLATFRLER